MLKFVLDTNALVSALISTGGNPALLLDKVGERYALYISKDILTEFEAVISRDKFGFTDKEINTIIEAVISFSQVVNPAIKLDVIKSDPDDNKILECAVACEADRKSVV
jgi:putative PIN family toxin of toxin-antitoxin system